MPYNYNIVVYAYYFPTKFTLFTHIFRLNGVHLPTYRPTVQLFTIIIILIFLIFLTPIKHEILPLLNIYFMIKLIIWVRYNVSTRKQNVGKTRCVISMCIHQKSTNDKLYLQIYSNLHVSNIMYKLYNMLPSMLRISHYQ